MTIGTLRIVAPLARGGMGNVFLAFREGETFRRMLALKKLDAHGRSASAEERLLTEAAYAAKIRHPNVVEVIDIGEDDEGPYVLMEFVQGLSLGDLLAKTEARLPLQMALRIGLALARGLNAAHSLVDEAGHSLGLIHRDVSPGNVLVGFDGAVRLTDFGLARSSRDPMTQELLRGTSGYISPEQLTFAHVDQRADLFSLGVVLYEMLSGSRLYGEDDVRIAARRTIHDTAPSVLEAAPHLNDEVVAIVDGLLQKEPGKRPKSAANVVRSLELAIRRNVIDEGPQRLKNYLEESVPTAIQEQRTWLADKWRALEASDGAPAPSTSAEAEPKPRPNPRRRTGALAALIAVLVALGFVLAWARRTPDPSGNEAAVETSSETPEEHFATPVAVPAQSGVAPESEPVRVETVPAAAMMEVRRDTPRRESMQGMRMRAPTKRDAPMDCVLGWDGRCR